MAALGLQVNCGECAITSTPKTILTIKAPTNQRVKIKGFEITGKGTSNTDTPVKCEVALITTNSQTGTASTVTPAPLDGDYAETPQTVCYKNYGTEPNTYGVVLRTWEVHPQTGLFLYAPMHDEIVLKGGQELGLRLTSNQNETMAMVALIEE